MNSTKMNICNLLGSLGQYFIKNIKLKKKSVRKQYLLWLVCIMTKKKIPFHFNSWFNIIKILARERTKTLIHVFLIIEKVFLIFFMSTWYHLKINNSLWTSFFESSFVLVVCSNIFKLQMLIKDNLVNNIPLRFYQSFDSWKFAKCGFIVF
jgi:hypothetical protein